MTGVTLNRLSRWSQGVGVVALGGLAWAIFVPGGLFWLAIAVVGLVGAIVATTLLLRVRSVPTLAQVITSAEGKAGRFPPPFRTILHPSGRARP